MGVSSEHPNTRQRRDVPDPNSLIKRPSEQKKKKRIKTGPSTLVLQRLNKTKKKNSRRKQQALTLWSRRPSETVNFLLVSFEHAQTVLFQLAPPTGSPVNQERRLVETGCPIERRLVVPVQRPDSDGSVV